MTQIYFRADAGPRIGYGHFTRTLALADMLKDDFRCTFFTCHPTPYQVGEMQKVCPHVALSEESHLDDFLNYLKGDEIVVLDNYFFTTDYQRAIKAKGCKLVCVDDMHNRHYVADVVINHALTDPTLFDVEPYTKLCLGFDWALLRRPFIEAANRPHPHTGRIENVTITFGGVDWNDLTGFYIRQAMNIPSACQITAVVGDGYNPINPRVKDKRVVYRSNLSAREMADLFGESDLVICPASTVSIEAIACGAKLAVGWYVDNQADYYAVLQSSDAIIPLGYIADSPMPIHPSDLTRKESIQISRGIRERYIAQFKQLEAGEYLREARPADVDLLFRWANDPVVRRNAFHTESIPYADHCRWLAACLQRSDVRIFIYVRSGEPVGQVRLNIERGEAEIDYSISPEHRGKGLGSSIIRLMVEKATTLPEVTTLKARVKKDNTPSQRVFLRNDFVESEDMLNRGG